MKALLKNITIQITLPETTPKREPFTIWINRTHGTWGFVNLVDSSCLFLCKADTDYINGVVEKVCAFATTL